MTATQDVQTLQPDELFNTFSIKDRIYSYLNASETLYDSDLAEVLKDRAAELVKWAIHRQILESRKEVRPGQLRGSNAGPCARKIAYGYLGFEPKGKEIDARAKLTFLNGDLLELVVVFLTKLVGVQTRGTCLDEGGQIDLTLKINDKVEVPGHPDGILLVQPGLEEEHLFEIKSASDFSFKRKFERLEIDDGYKLQHMVYMEALGLKKGVFLAVNKNSGELAEVWTEYDPEYVEWARHNYVIATAARPNKLPTRYYGDGYGVIKNKKGEYVLAPLCGYCSYRDECFNVSVDASRGKPIFKLNELPDDLPEDFQ